MNDSEKRPLRLAQPGSPGMAEPWIGGVASGVAERSGIAVRWVRTGFVVLSAVFGVGFLLYLWLWMSLRADGEQYEGAEGRFLALPLRRLSRSSPNQAVAGQLLLGGIAFLVVGATVALSTALWSWRWEVVLAVIAVMVGLLLTWVQAPKFTASRRQEAAAYAATGLALVLGGTAVLFAQAGWVKGKQSAFLVVALVAIGWAAALVPLVVRVLGDLSLAREREAREAERAHIAAHLHDSVLQTLTLIRGAAEDPGATRALALAQEKELRSWLYADQPQPDRSLAQLLREQVAALEASHGVPVEVVTVGDAQPTVAQQAGVAAATEAVTNAIKHGKPPITVFQEVRGGDLEIYVKDAGDGFDPDAIPPDRHGYRGSIVDRVERVGGSAGMRMPGQPDAEGSGAGTEIHIFIPGPPN